MAKVDAGLLEFLAQNPVLDVLQRRLPAHEKPELTRPPEERGHDTALLGLDLVEPR